MVIMKEKVMEVIYLYVEIGEGISGKTGMEWEGCF
jgi:hypothetical protein